MAYRRVEMLAKAHAAYLAGLIDGEGTITLSRRHAGDRRQLVVSISSTEKPMLDWVLATVGAGKITRKRVGSPRHAPSFTYAVSNRQALELLSQTMGHLRSYKRLRAELALEKYVELTPRNGKYSAERAAARDDFEKQLLSLQPASDRQPGARAPEPTR